jgi:hypothetical protein
MVGEAGKNPITFRSEEIHFHLLLILNVKKLGEMVSYGKVSGVPTEYFVLGQCSRPRMMPITAKKCCCSMGLAWGRQCEQCPRQGSGIV